MQIIIGNIVALGGSLMMIYSGYLKSKKKILFTQTIQIMLFILSNIILGGISGAIINAISCIRNILCYKDKLTKVAKAIIIILATSLTLYFNTLGFIGILPLISTITYILLMNIKHIIKFKYLIIFTMILWLAYDIYIQSYTSAFFDFTNIIINFISIIQIAKKNLNRLI